MRAALDQPEDIRARMDRMYRPQALIYDLTRKPYLLGRDRLIAGIDARPGEILLEVGCGTGRNLVAIGRRYPGVALLGVDAAAPMLATALKALQRHRLAGRARLARGLAEGLDLAALFDLARPVDHVLISYTLSMVEEPATALRAALRVLRPGGVLHVVDFGDQAGLPGWFRHLLAAWLRRFDTHCDGRLDAAMGELASAGLGELERGAVFGRYAVLFRFRRAVR